MLEYNKLLDNAVCFLSRVPFLMLISLVMCFPAHGAEMSPSSPKKLVLDFYAANAKLPAVTNLSQAEPFTKFLSSDLYRLMKRALEADEAYLKKNPTDKGYFGDGVSFVGNPDGSTSYLIKTVIPVAPKSVKVEVRFSYIDKRKPKEWSSTWSNVIHLTLENNRWMIDDIEYRDGGRLSADLKKAIEESQE